MKLGSLAFSLMVFGAAIPYAQAQDTETREVYISGIGSDKNEAIKDALSKAVAQVCGQRVSTSQNIESDMKSQANYSSDGKVSSVDRTKRSNEKVNALSDGMAEKYEILSETKLTSGNIKLDVLTTVGKCFEPNSVTDQVVFNTDQTNKLLSKMLEAIDRKSEPTRDNTKNTYEGSSLTGDVFEERYEGSSLTGDVFEERYAYGYKLWEARSYPEARAILEETLSRFPKHKRVSYARYLLGRVWLDEKNPAAAVKILFGNYKSDPRGDRAPESLFFLGCALTDLGKTAAAREAFENLKKAYSFEVNGRLAPLLNKGCKKPA